MLPLQALTNIHFAPTAPVWFAHTDIALTKPVPPLYQAHTFLPVFDAYQLYLPMSFSQHAWSIAACFLQILCSSVHAESMWGAIQFEDVL